MILRQNIKYPFFWFGYCLLTVGFSIETCYINTIWDCLLQYTICKAQCCTFWYFPYKHAYMHVCIYVVYCKILKVKIIFYKFIIDRFIDWCQIKLFNCIGPLRFCLVLVPALLMSHIIKDPLLRFFMKYKSDQILTEKY